MEIVYENLSVYAAKTMEQTKRMARARCLCGARVRRCNNAVHRAALLAFVYADLPTCRRCWVNHKTKGMTVTYAHVLTGLIETRFTLFNVIYDSNIPGLMLD
jgi:hypothetical protein